MRVLWSVVAWGMHLLDLERVVCGVLLLCTCRTRVRYSLPPTLASTVACANVASSTGGGFIQSQACNAAQACPITGCSFSAWTVWSACSKPCGGGTQVSSRQVTAGATTCGPVLKTQLCNTQVSERAQLGCQLQLWSWLMRTLLPEAVWRGDVCRFLLNAGGSFLWYRRALVQCCPASRQRRPPRRHCRCRSSLPRSPGYCIVQCRSPAKWDAAHSVTPHGTMLRVSCPL